MREAERTANLLAYCSIVIKQAWITTICHTLNTTHFRRQAATKPNEPWAQLNAALWTIYFTWAKAKNVHSEEDASRKSGGSSSSSMHASRVGGNDPLTAANAQPYHHLPNTTN